MQIDALREVCNICAGNASIALSQMLGKKIDLSVPRANMLPLAQVTGLVGGEEASVAGVFLSMEGDCSGSILLLLEKESALTLAGLMIRKGQSVTEDEDVKTSALHETGSILLGAYLNALGHLTSLYFKPTVPAFAMDMAGAIMSYILSDLAAVEDFVLAVETDFSVSGQKIGGHLIMFPGFGALETITARLGVPIE
jgi:chemotaxis protein CheC